ncbi:Clr5 domain-containing protein [Xylariales sp. PMI_506]|nr:Clr5 domain-containing protein [Xylariales sp. PMI_506]
MDSVYHVPPGSDLYTLLSACCPSTDTSGLSWSSFSTPSDDDSPYGSPSFNQSDSRVDSLMCNGVRNDGRGEQCAGDAAAALLSPTISLPSPRHRRRNVKPSLSSGFIGMQSKFSTNSKTYMLPQAPEAWECRKRELRCLYLEQDKTLKDIMYIMEQKGFKASVKMYKTRFKQWGFVKNNSREDITKMLQIRRQRATVGKSTTFKRNGKTVKIDEYLRKNGAIIWEPRGYGTPEGLPNSVRCHTPPLDTPRHLRTSDTLLLKELLIWCLKDLSPSFFHLTRHGNKTNSVNSELWDVPRYLRLACDLFSESRHSQAGSICRSAFTYGGPTATLPRNYGTT